MSECTENTNILNGHATDTESKEDAEKHGERILQVKISSPGGDVFNLSISTGELIQEIHRVLVDREETCHRTCFSLQYEGQTLDLFVELKNVENLTDECEFTVVEEKYSQREARTHIKHINDLLRSLDLRDCYLGRDQLSLTFLSSIMESDDEAGKNTKKPSFNPPDVLLPNVEGTTVPLTTLHPFALDLKSIQCLKQLTYSDWNPPHTQRKMAGDLLYLVVQTLEDKRIHITACPKGFYINQSDGQNFNHKPMPGFPVCHSLVDLLKKFSPGFKKNFDVLMKKRAQKNPLERAPTPYQKFSWLSPVIPHEADSIRKEEVINSRMASDENLPGQPRDWNDELQMSRELPRASINERLLRDRSIFKTNSDFIMSASRAAVSVVNGDIMAINPGENRKHQMYIWNNMFFSFGFDIKDHYKDFGGEAAAHVATSSDLNGIRAYALFDHPGLHTLGTAIIDYRGYRVTAQTIIPGILEKDQEKLVVYGSIDFGKTVVSDTRYEELLEKTAKHLKIRPHEVLNEKNETIKLYSSVDCKGIFGNDNRVYVLDLLRTFPPDLNYLGAQPDSCRPRLSKSLSELGFPYKHVHTLSTLRQELVEAFVELKRDEFYKNALAELAKTTEQTENEADNDEEETKNKMIQKFVQSSSLVNELQNLETASEQVKEAAKMAATAVGSLREDSCEIAFNPDVFHQFVKFPGGQEAQIERDEKILVDACEFLVCEQIPRFVQDMMNHSFMPQDGQSLVDAMHQRGINVRYLNRVVVEIGSKSELQYALRIAVSEIWSRSVKHIFRQYIQDVDPMLVSAAVCHFLNCLFVPSTVSHLNPLAGVDDYVVKMINAGQNGISKGAKKNRKNKQHSTGGGKNEELAWTAETPVTVWNSIVKECADYYHYRVQAASSEQFLHAYRLPWLSLLRAFCQSTGVQIALKDYHINQSKPIFQIDDVINLFPVVKHLHPIASDAYHYYTTGQAKISAGQFQDGLTLITEALELLTTVYGPLHPDVGACNRLLARLYYVLGEHPTALLYQQRATIIAERVQGIDSPNTASEYLSLAVYAFACGKLKTALNSLYHARHICLLCHAEEHPEIAQIDTNIGLMLLVIEEFDLAALYLENGQRLNRIFHGTNSLKEAFNCHLVSRAHVYRGDYRKALEFEKLRYTIYQERLGPNSDYTRDSDECMKLLLNQAVSQARKAAQLQNNVSDAVGKVGTATKKSIHSSSNKLETNDQDHHQQQVADTGSGSKLNDTKSLNQRLANCSLTADSVSSSPFAMPGGAYSMFQFPNLLTILETINRVNGIYVLQFQSVKPSEETEKSQQLKPIEPEMD